jgi:hypothetical protein
MNGLDLILVDDSKRPAKAVYRPGMGPLVAVGGMHVPGDSVRPLAIALETMCEEYGFPSSEEFKWSPGRETWMRKRLTGGTRKEFFVDCLESAAQYGVQGCIVVEDESHRSTSGGDDNHELDVVKLFLERCHGHLEGTNTEAIVIADHPSGGRPAEAEFAATCLRTLRVGTGYVRPDRIAMVLTEDSKNTRLLQMADLIVGCTLAYVAGDDRSAASLFEDHIRDLLRRSPEGRIGGFGLKLHPDRVYLNLYHWLLDDKDFHRYGDPFGIPEANHPYVNDARDPSTTKSLPSQQTSGPTRIGMRRARVWR